MPEMPANRKRKAAVTDDIITDDIITGEIITDEIITDDIITDDIITEEVTTGHSEPIWICPEPVFSTCPMGPTSQYP